MPVGGIKEKLLAAHRSGIKNVIIPIENVKDLKEIPDNIKADLDIKPVRWIDEVLTYALKGYSTRVQGKKTKKVKASLIAEIQKKEKVRKAERVRAH